MILADTSVWIDHLRSTNPQTEERLNKGQIVMHPFVVAELALGSIKDRRKKLSDLDLLLKVRVAQLSEVRQMIETNSLYSKGIGLTDAHLLASCLLSPGTKLWTRDAALERVAKILGVSAVLP